MPYKNRQKIYVLGSYYHLYARGVNKMAIFIERSDYRKFTYYLNKYLNQEYRKRDKLTDKYLPSDSVHNDIELICYCLMPNHFHTLCKNKSKY